MIHAIYTYINSERNYLLYIVKTGEVGWEWCAKAVKNVSIDPQKGQFYFGG